ncbi:hypothetical protein VPNG_07343 [Cytospora leucostoma]|uniref:Uncharacterized protein n=1 Tax=Cytospora leucostoma TaxID=1230097 RepID=A0A423WUX0_9PEZI|nr:hypothetical protein VPNG_07343 [Cytospora leucostoma]
MESQNSSTPAAPYGLNPNQYKVNVSRQKTRKWVEAKAQNYDGDDWGAEDEYDEYDNNDDGTDTGRPEYDQPAQQQPIPQPQRPGRLTAGLRAISAGGPSTPTTSLRPSERIALERQQMAALQRSVTGPPALHIHTPPRTQTAPIPQVAGPPEPPAAASQPFPPRKSSMASLRSDSPAEGVRSPASATGSPTIVRPADIYKRIDQEKEKERRSLESARRSSQDSIGRNNGENDQATNHTRRPSYGINDGGDGNGNLRPLESVAERKSEYGFDGLVVNAGDPPPRDAPYNIEYETAREVQPGAEPSNPSQPQPLTLQHPQARKELPTEVEPSKRYSTSPKLPLLSRLSGFENLFGSTGLGLISDSSKQPNPPAEATTDQLQTSSTMADSGGEPAVRNPAFPSAAPAGSIRPPLPGGWVTETATPGELTTPGSEDAKYGGDPAVNTNDDGTPENGQARPAPSQTTSPGEGSAAHAGDGTQFHSSGRSSPVELPPLRATPSPEATRERSALQEESGGLASANDSHDGEGLRPTSDANGLAIAPLQPRKGSAPESPEDLRPPILRVETYSSSQGNSSPLKESDFLRDEIMRSLSPARQADEFIKPPQDEGAPRESAYLSDVYGDYWSGDEDKPEAAATAEQRAEDPGEHEPNTSTVLEESSITPTPPAHTWTSETPSSAESTAAPAVVPGTDDSSPVQKRFSWEEGAEAHNSAPPSPTEQPLPGSWPEGPADLASPADAVLSSPMLELPTINFGDNDMDSRLVSSTIEVPPGHRYSVFGPSSPGSNAGDRDGLSAASGGYGSNNHSYLDEKMLIQSPMYPVSPMEPIGMQDNDNEQQPTQGLQRAATPPEIAPEVVPLPSSPTSLSKPRSQPVYNTQTLKQVLQLPTSADRVHKMKETREHYAELDSGLSMWITEMMTHPQHQNAMPTYNYALSGADAELWGTKGGARIPLNAPAEDGAHHGSGGGQSHNTGGGSAMVPHIGRSTSGSVNLGHLVMHSGQAGAKGKELLQSAGKLSKGLLSKGKNKLRERAESKKG